MRSTRSVRSRKVSDKQSVEMKEKKEIAVEEEFVEEPEKTKNKSRKGRKNTEKNTSSKNYKKYEQREHVYKVPGMYIGSDQQIERKEWLYKDGVVVEEWITLPQGVQRLFIELLSNATDNANRSRRANVDPKYIQVFMDTTTLSVKNYGLPIPIEIHEEGMYVPELVFGTMLTSSNYEKDRLDGGVNGLGAKLCNIFSTRFYVEVLDAERGLFYRQEWHEQMTKRGEPIIEETDGEESYVHIEFDLDFRRFGYEEYPEEAFDLYKRHCIDASCTCRIPVYFNDEEFNYQDIREYAALYFPDMDLGNYILHYEWPKGTKVATVNGRQIDKTGMNIPLAEVLVLDTPNIQRQVSFVNSIMTRDGGPHVEEVFKVVAEAAKSIVNKTELKIKTPKDKKNKKKKKEDKKEDKKKDKVKKSKVTIVHVKPHVSLFVVCVLVNPTFIGQTKDKIVSPIPEYAFSRTELLKIGKWKLIQMLNNVVKAMDLKLLSATDGKKQKFTKTKGERANEAGGPRSHECVLFLVEGESAMSFAKSYVDLLPDGNDFAGLFPFQGKPLNVLKIDVKRLIANKEWSQLKIALALKEEVDYTKDENWKSLNYGSVVIMADADDDGKHIVGLILVYFYCRFPSLLQRGYVHVIRTPLLKAIKGEKCVKFYSLLEYKQWIDEEPEERKDWIAKYYKGLGSNSDMDLVQDIEDYLTMCCVYDDRTPEAIDLAFDKRRSNERKEWIAHWQPRFKVEDVEMVPISKFIDEELIEFCVANLHRSIPRRLDGLKECQRKILWAALKRWVWTGAKQYKEVKLGTFGHNVAEITHYHHGEQCLIPTIANMSHSFVGSNNLPYFYPDGQLGSRRLGGTDCAKPRYAKIYPEKWLKYVFLKEDFDLLEILEDEGDPIEPKSLLPIIPLHVINGCAGVGSGWSTFIPAHNPLDVINWYKARLCNEEVQKILPWYRDFKGTIEFIEKTDVKKKLFVLKDKEEEEEDDRLAIPKTEEEMEEGEEEELVEQLEQLRKSKIQMVTKGVYEVDENGDVIVSELPIGYWTVKYSNWLDELVRNGKIKDVKNKSTKDTVCFIIQGFSNPNTSKLKLKRSYGMTNMTLLDLNNYPIRYNDINEIMEAFYEERLPYYEKRKLKMVADLEKKIHSARMKLDFIQAVNEEKIDIHNRESKVAREQTKKLGFDEKLLKEVYLISCTMEKVDKLKKQIEKSEVELEELRNRTPESLWYEDLCVFEKVYLNFDRELKERIEVKERKRKEADKKSTRKSKPRKRTKKQHEVK